MRIPEIQCGGSAPGSLTTEFQQPSSPHDRDPVPTELDEDAGEGEPRLTQGGTVSVRGVLQVHSAPPALCPHIEWAVAGILGVPVRLSWVDQPASPGTLRAELDWHGKPGGAAAITSALAAWRRV